MQVWNACLQFFSLKQIQISSLTVQTLCSETCSSWIYDQSGTFSFMLTSSLYHKLLICFTEETKKPWRMLERFCFWLMRDAETADLQDLLFSHQTAERTCGMISCFQMFRSQRSSYTRSQTLAGRRVSSHAPRWISFQLIRHLSLITRRRGWLWLLDEDFDCTQLLSSSLLI